MYNETVISCFNNESSGGTFMGLFDKKYCDICGKEIKLLGNRKLDDGNMCKDCASKLSPWFSGRRHTSVAAIKEQLEYRKQNEAKLSGFTPSKIIGKRYKVYIDENRKQFLVSASSNWRNNNPDLISISDVRDIKITVDEDRDEVYTEDGEGKKVSYDPPRYEYEYKFDVDIDVNNKFFDDLKFELTSDRPDSPDSESYAEYVAMADEIMRSLLGRGFAEDRSKFKYSYTSSANRYESGTDEWFCPKCGSKNNGAFCTKCGTARPAIFTPFYCGKCGEKISDPETVYCPKCGNKVR